jgi:hypothetical protein
MRVGPLSPPPGGRLRHASKQHRQEDSQHRHQKTASKHARNAHEAASNTDCRRHKQTRQPADHTATAPPTNTRHADTRLTKQTGRSKSNGTNNNGSMQNRPTQPTTAHATASDRKKGAATECDGNKTQAVGKTPKHRNQTDFFFSGKKVTAVAA